jgi:hypothetical protein
VRDNSLDLGLKLPAPEVSPEQVEQLVNVLMRGLHWLTEEERTDANGWMTAAQIASQLEDMSDRQVRKIAGAAAPAVVSFPGSPGYKLWGACTVDEINHAIEAFEAQATDMIKRANLYRSAYHRRFRGSS